MDCTFIEKNLFAISESTLTGKQADDAREHLEACPSCRALLAGFMSALRIIESDRQLEPDPFLQTRLLQKMESRALEQVRGPALNFGLLLRPVLAAALILLAVITGIFTGRQGKIFSRDSSRAKNISEMRADLFIPEMNDEDKILELYK
jgi:hypothetical protein